MKRGQNRQFRPASGSAFCVFGPGPLCVGRRAGLRYQASDYQDPYLPVAQAYNWKDPGTRNLSLSV